MAVDEGARHRLFDRLEEILGPEEARILMEHLPPVGWADVATKADISALRAGTKADIDTLRAELTADLRAEIIKQTRTVVFTTMGAMVSLGALLLGAVKL